LHGVAKVATLTYYPVKGLGGISVGEAEVLAAGLRHDREFMLVDRHLRKG
jgi:MOSC domain-containing protein